MRPSHLIASAPFSWCPFFSLPKKYAISDERNIAPMTMAKSVAPPLTMLESVLFSVNSFVQE